MNSSAAGGGGGPHNDSLFNLIEDNYWNGIAPAPLPSYAHGQRYGCYTRRCHATNVHGGGTSRYKAFAAKLLFNNSPAQDAAYYGVPDDDPDGYGGEDQVWNFEGATDAAVDRFVTNANLRAGATIISTDSAGQVLFTREGTTTASALNTPETHTIVAGLTCGRPSVGDNDIGNDECHAEAAYAILDDRFQERRNHATGITGGSAYRTDNTGEEALGYGGNDNRDWKTGHLAGVAAAGQHGIESEWAPISSCTSCHDQTDEANKVAGNFTFPHGQTPTGVTNLVKSDLTSATGLRARIWSGYGAKVGAPLVYTDGTNAKAYDGQCIKCHRDASGASGVGITY